MKKITGLILFGESVVAGRGVKDRRLSFGRLLKEKLPIPVLIKGKSYITTEDALNRVDKEVIRKDKIYSHVLLLIGNNDPRLVGFNKPKFSISEFKSNMEQLIRKIQNDGRDVIVCNLQPLDDEDIHRIHPAMPKFLEPPTTPYEWHTKYSDACKEIALACEVQFIDIRAKLEEEKKKGKKVIADYCLDPNATGHLIIAETILKNLYKKYNIEAK